MMFIDLFFAAEIRFYDS